MQPVRPISSEIRTHVVTLDGCATCQSAVNRKLINRLAGVAKLDGRLPLPAAMKIRRAAASLVVSIVLSTPLYAGSATTKMMVSVQVIAAAIVTVDSPRMVDVTAADVSRGYVDVPAPLVLHGRTNSRRGYLLECENTSDEFRDIDLEFPNASMNIGGHESWLQRPYVPGGEVVPVRARLFLAKGAAPGSHPLPVSFSASPL